jgi:hypothetical protein
MPELAQHIVVTLAALSAAAIIVRRVFGAIAPGSRSGTPCDSCPSAALHRKRLPQNVESSQATATKPMILVRRGTSAGGGA